jgi:ankyrin repeat protein
MGQSLVREAATESRVLEASANAPKPDLISKLLPKRTKKADKKDERGETALHRAVWLGQSELVTQLAKKQIDASVENDDGLTAFHLALLYGKVDLARILLDESASKVSCDATFGRNPFNLDYSISGILFSCFSCPTVFLSSNYVDV